MEVGVITGRDNGLKLTLFYTLSHKVKEFQAHLDIPEPLEAIYADLHITECSPNRQEKQLMSFKPPAIFKFDQPKLTATLKLTND